MPPRGVQAGHRLAAYWSLKILLDLGGWRSLGRISFARGEEQPLLRLIGFEPFRSEFDALDEKAFHRFLRRRKRELERALREPGDIVSKNLERLGKLVGLSGLEKTILTVAVLLKLHSGFEEAFETLGALNRGSVVPVLAAILEVPAKDIHEAVRTRSLLFRSGLLRLGRHLSGLGFETIMEPMEGLAGLLTVPHDDPATILEPYFHSAPGPTLAESDFDYLGGRYETIRSYLAHSVNRKTAGTNVLLYGRPGTGKTEMVRTLARALGLKLFEVAFADPDGDPISGSHRFSAYQLCQQVLSRQKKTLVLFDEIEDVFTDHSPWWSLLDKPAVPHKAWVNWILEENPVPAVWICNDISRLGNAFIRRFDMVMQLDHPPLRTRARILEKHLDGLPVSRKWIECTAQSPDIAPAVVARAAKVAAAVGRKAENTEAVLQEVLGNTLKAMGYPEPTGRNAPPPVPYRLDALNPDRELEPVLRGLKKHPHGRLCLYGPPGTGKSEFGRHLAAQLERPIILKRASDLLSPYVGGTERQIAEMFRQAEADNAVLMLDEADGFLRDRTGAYRSWEVTQVNELLTRMESFDGVFLCSTNLVESLDKASLRRFDLKIHFGYLKAEQAWVLFRQVVGKRELRGENAKYWRGRLGQLEDLTPGDFAAVVRRSSILGNRLDAEEVMVGLEEEVGFRLNGRGRGIGFSAFF